MKTEKEIAYQLFKVKYLVTSWLWDWLFTHVVGKQKDILNLNSDFNPWYLWGWPYLEMGSLPTSLRWGPTYWMRIGPKSSHWCSYKKKKIWTQTPRRVPSDDRVKGWNDVSGSWGTPRLWQTLEAGRGQDIPSPNAFRGSTAWPAPWSWISGLQNWENECLLVKLPVHGTLLQ